MSDAVQLRQWSSRKEGQFFERKSAIDKTKGDNKARNPKALAWDIIETLCAMANADGGDLIIGMENDGTPTGVPHRASVVQWLSSIPADRNYVNPPLPYTVQQVHAEDDQLLLYFRAHWSPSVHQLANGRYLLRVTDRNMPFEAKNIEALKQTKSQGLYEGSFPPNAKLSDIDLDLVAPLVTLLGDDASAADVLRFYRLAEEREGELTPCLAGLLLFGKDVSRWHPRCGIEFVRWEGRTRKHGKELNIQKRRRIEEPLSVIIRKAYDAIEPFIRERRQLLDLFFTERLEYPAFAWQEAIVNAVAHRDYGIRGAAIEVSMFDDRLEIHSPGPPPSPVTIEDLRQRKHVHLSRNPRLVRVLTDLGYMQELGEGIPRMFEIMEQQGFYPPRLDVIGEVTFQVSLRNEPVYDQATLEWFKGYEDRNLTGNQKRIMAYGKAHGGQFRSRDYQRLVGLSLYEASNSIKDMIRKRVVRSLGKGSRVYEIVEPFRVEPEMPDDLVRLLPVLHHKGSVNNGDIRQLLNVDRQTAWRTARRLVDEGWLVVEGEKRGRRYCLAG